MVTYRKVQNKFCYGIYESFRALSDAKTACTRNPECTMIYDIECQEIGYNVCKGEIGDSFGEGSCVYIKEASKDLNIIKKQLLI